MLVRFYSPHKGGNEHQCQLLSEYLTANNYNVIIITERYSLKLLKNEIINGVKIIRLNSLNTYLDINKVKPNSFFKKLFRFGFYYAAEYSLMINIFFFIRLRKSKNSILHIHQNNWIAFWGIIGVNGRIPVVTKDATLNGFNELKLMPFSAFMQKSIIKKSHFIAVSTDIKTNLLNYSINEKRIHFIPNSVVLPTETNQYRNLTDFLFVGNFDQGKIKGLDILIEAFLSVSKSFNSIRLVIIGKGDPNLYKMILSTDHNHSNCILFLGPQCDVSKYYKSSFVFVLPSRSEGMSNSLLEAMSFGIPCISTMVSGSKDLIINNENGLLVPVDSTKALEDAIAFMYTNPLKAAEMGINGRKTIEKKFSSTIVYPQYPNLYKKITNDY